MRKRYVNSPLRVQALAGLERFMKEAADRTEAQKRRLREMQAELSAEANTKMDEIHVINEKIGTKMASS